MNIPVVLSVIRVHIDTEGVPSVELDGRQYAADRRLSRADIAALLDEITTDLDAAVRVEIHEADGTKYTDIATPPAPVATGGPLSAREPSASPRPEALTGAGFDPGEQVALAYVVTRQAADADGHAVISLPPALLAATRGGLVMLGLTSQRVAAVEAPA